MSRYGLEVFRPDGTSIVMDNQTTVAKIVGMGGKASSYGEWNTSVTIPVGYEYFLWMSKYAWLEYIVARNGGRSQFTPNRHAYNQPYLDAHRVLKVNSVNYNTSIPASYYGVYTWPKETVQGHYGVQFFGVNNISGINDISLFSCLLFKGEIALYNGWLPSHVNPAFTPDRVMCFFYTEDTRKTLSTNAAGRYKRPTIVQSYKVFDVGGGGSSTDLRAKVCIFGNGTLQRSHYGLEIYNANSTLVYNSGYDILARPKMVSLSGLALGEKRSIEGVARPMYAPCNIGGLYTQHWMVDVWVNSNGTQIGPAWGHAIYKSASFGHDTYFTGDIPIMVLDATDYFHF